MTPEEVTHFAHRLADLIVTATRAQTPAQLAEVRLELVDTFEQAFTLQAHDTTNVLDPIELARDLVEPITREMSALARRNGAILR